MIEIYLRFWITGFNPKMVPGTVHHMAVAGCSERPPRTDHNVWNCGANGNPVLEPQYPSFVVRHDMVSGNIDPVTEIFHVQDLCWWRPVYLHTVPMVKEWSSLHAASEHWISSGGRHKVSISCFAGDFSVVFMLPCCCHDYFNSKIVRFTILTLRDYLVLATLPE